MEDMYREMLGFLKANSFTEDPHSEPAPEEGLHPFITISREYGAGGLSLAQALVETFKKQESELFKGWQVLDNELCEKLVTDTRLNHAVRDLISEEYYSEVQAFVYSLLGDPSQKTQVYKQLFDLIRTLATFGKVIIIGRAGSCITESLAHGVHVRLTASLQSRVERVRSIHADPLKVILQKDRDRAKLIRVHFQRDIKDPLLYDVVCNTDRLSFNEISGLVMSLVNERVKTAGSVSGDLNL